MANIKQQKKRIGTAQRQRMENLRYRSTIKTLFNRLQLNVDTGDKDAANTTHQELVDLLDRAITRGSLHRNTAARKKARASRMLLQEAKKDATTIRKARKKTVTPARKPKAETAAKADAKKPAAKKPAARKPAVDTADAATPEEAEAPVVEAEATTPAPEAKTEALETPSEESEAPTPEEAPAEVADAADATEAKE